MLIINALARFETQLEADGRSVHTQKQYRRHVLALARWAAGERLSLNVDDFTHEHLAQFLASPVANTRPDGAKKRATSTNALRSSLRVFFRYLHEAGVVEANPARLIKRAITAPPPPRALTAQEEKQFLAVLAKARAEDERRDAFLFTLMLRTGIRLSSAIGLDVGDVDLAEQALLLRTVKGDRVERVILPRKLVKTTRAFIGERTSGPLFLGQSRRRLSHRHAQRRFRELRDRAGIESAVSPHSLRHSFGVSFLRKTGDIALVQRALGHRSITSTLIYARVDDARLRAAMGA